MPWVWVINHLLRGSTPTVCVFEVHSNNIAKMKPHWTSKTPVKIDLKKRKSWVATTRKVHSKFQGKVKATPIEFFIIIVRNLIFWYNFVICVKLEKFMSKILFSSMTANYIKKRNSITIIFVTNPKALKVHLHIRQKWSDCAILNLNFESYCRYF
jgi:hypothetical protein